VLLTPPLTINKQTTPPKTTHLQYVLSSLLLLMPRQQSVCHMPRSRVNSSNSRGVRLLPALARHCPPPPQPSPPQTQSNPYLQCVLSSLLLLMPRQQCMCHMPQSRVNSRHMCISSNSRGVRQWG
jgi:hypothetical protein